MTRASLMPRKFQRPPDLEAEWQALGSPEERAFWDRLDAARAETVIAARRYYNDAPFVDRIDEILLRRIEPMIRSAVRGVARDEAVLYREEIEGIIVEAFWREVLQVEDTFYEIRCLQKLRRAALDARRKVIGRKARTLERQAIRIRHVEDTEDDSAGVIAEDTIADSRDEYAEVEKQLDWFISLASMPREVAMAIDLHYRAELKIHSGNPNELTVSKALRCSERKARELIRIGEEIRRGQTRELANQEVP